MNLGRRIKLAAQAMVGKATGTLNVNDLVGKATGTLNVNDLWLRGGYMGNVTTGLSSSDFVAAAYSSSAIAYACIDRMAKDAAGVPLVYLSDPEDFESEVGDNDPVRLAFEYPAKGYTTRRLVGWTTMIRQLRGECMWYVPEVSSRRIDMMAAWYDPRRWKELVDAEEGLVGWEYSSNSERFRATTEEVLWVGQDNPSTPYRGISPLQAAARSLGIDVMGDTLQEDMIRRGGERGLVASSEVPLTEEQYEQLIADLSARRPGAGQASRDFILDGLKLENPDFTKEDIDFLAWQNAAKDKICHVYGMAPVLIGDDDAAQFKSAPEAIKLYWQQTLVPLLRSYEDAWDNFFVRTHNLKTYVRFDLSRVSALKADELANATVAKIYWDMLLPFASINDKLGLGFDDEAVAFVDGMDVTARKPAPLMAPSQPQDDDPDREPAKSRNKGLTNAVIKARAADSRFTVQRERRRERVERSTWNAIKKSASEYRDQTIEAAKAVIERDGVNPVAAYNVHEAIAASAVAFGNDLAKSVKPGHVESAQLGVASVQELVDGKFLAWHDRIKAVSFAQDIDEAMAIRQAWLRGKTGPKFVQGLADLAFKEIMATLDALRTGEITVADVIRVVAKVMREQWSEFSRVRASTIARTEVAAIYEKARYEEMGRQEFTHHEWVTAMDEATRDSHELCNGEVRRRGEEFPNGLIQPCQTDAPPEEVINCRCSTIPVVVED